MTFKVPPHLLSLLILFLSLCLTSLALRRDPETAEVLRCLDEVDGGVWNPPAHPSRSERDDCACERQAGGQQRQLCKFRCRRQREREERERSGGGDVNLSLDTTTEDPQQQFQHCQQRCEQQHGREPKRRQCRQECERHFREQRRCKQISTNPREQEEEEEEMGEWGDNPYYFHSWTLRSRFRSEEGRIRVLEQFDRRSDLLRALKNHRLEIFDANPSTFVLPHHIDADCILVVLKG